MQEFYDASEARAPELRERKQFAKMPELIAGAERARLGRAVGLRRG